MALLTGKRAPRLATACALFCAAALAGCVLLERLAGGEEGLAFSHERHVTVEGLDCFNCHEHAMVREDPGMPSPDTCQSCHLDFDEEKPPERRAESLFADGAFRAARFSALEDEVVFSHRLHVRADIECATCHTGIETNERVGPELAVDMAACVDCHRALGQPAECATCHTYVDGEWEPESHGHNWQRFHGQVARMVASRTADRCELCHSEPDCIACHLEMPPDSHTNFFRRRGHGLQAMLDRQSCAACHRADSCDRCHREIVPLSHVGQWGGTRSNHCLTCHFPLASEGCVACHTAAPSHALGSPKPPDHNAAMNCRQCHGLTAPLPHADKGDDCNACHP